MKEMGLEGFSRTKRKMVAGLLYSSLETEPWRLTIMLENGMCSVRIEACSIGLGIRNKVGYLSSVFVLHRIRLWICLFGVEED